MYDSQDILVFVFFVNQNFKIGDAIIDFLRNESSLKS